MDLYPAGRGRHLFPSVFLAPALHEGYPDGAHPRQVVDGLEAVVDTVGEEGVELLSVEYLEGAVGRDLADGCGVPAMVLVTVWRLHKDCGVGETLGNDVPVIVIELHSLANVLPGLLHDAAPVQVGEKSQAEPLPTAGVCEPVHRHGLLRGVVVLADPGVELVVGDGAPVLRLAVHHRLQLQGGVGERGGDGGQISHSLAQWGPVTIGVVSHVAGCRRSYQIGVVEVVKTPVVAHIQR